MLVAVAVPVLVTVAVAVDAGGGVIVSVLESTAEVVCLCRRFSSGGSQQPKKRPGVSQVSESDVVWVAVDVLGVDVVVVLSQPPPNQPGLHVVEVEAVVDAETDDVLVGGSVVVVTVRFADSLHPNQPGVKQVVVVYVVVATG